MAIEKSEEGIHLKTADLGSEWPSFSLGCWLMSWDLALMSELTMLWVKRVVRFLQQDWG